MQWDGMGWDGKGLMLDERFLRCLLVIAIKNDALTVNLSSSKQNCPRLLADGFSLEAPERRRVQAGGAIDARGPTPSS